MKKDFKLQRTIFIGILCSQGIILGLIETLLPPILAFAPGAKIGLSQIVTLFALFTLPFSDCLLLTIIRLILTSLISGGATTFVYAFAGSMLSLLIMELLLFLYKAKFISLIGVSIAGAVFHNLGQLLVASLIANTDTVMLYLPILTVMGIFSGFAVGLVTMIFLTHLSKLDFSGKYLFNLKGPNL